MPKTIEKKIWPDQFDNDQQESVDFRLADFDLEKGDVIRFREWDPRAESYTGREFSRTVGAVSKHNSPTRYWSVDELEKHGIYIIEWDQE